VRAAPKCGRGAGSLCHAGLRHALPVLLKSPGMSACAAHLPSHIEPNPPVLLLLSLDPLSPHASCGAECDHIIKASGAAAWVAGGGVGYALLSLPCQAMPGQARPGQAMWFCLSSGPCPASSWLPCSALHSPVLTAGCIAQPADVRPMSTVIAVLSLLPSSPPSYPTRCPPLSTLLLCSWPSPVWSHASPPSQSPTLLSHITLCPPPPLPVSLQLAEPHLERSGCVGA